MSATQNNPSIFPYEDAKPRLERYSFNDKLFEGAHWEAFVNKISHGDFNKQHASLKYIAGNFAGLISKVAADMLFSEPISVRASKDNKDLQTWIDAFVYQNHLDVQNYESALGNSRHGDAVYKLRIGKLRPGDAEMTVIAEDITPSIYFPTLSTGNMRQEPTEKELAWQVSIAGKKYVRKEIHTPGKIHNQLWLLEGDKLKQEASLDLLGEEGLTEHVETKIQQSLIFHIPNWKDGSRYFGYDDYGDLLGLMFGLNNRVTKNENILDKHSDPILALPEGVLDEEGKVKKEAFHMFEIPSDATGGAPAKPEYIVWNANLEAAFKQIDTIVEFLYMFSETSPDAFGLSKNSIPESGRALKLRLMRTIAKVARKRLYYDMALKDMFHTAQVFAEAHSVGVFNEKSGKYDLRSKKPEVPEIEWQDGLPIDSYEAAEEERIRLESGNTSVVDSIMRLDRVDEDTAKEKQKTIDSEKPSITLPSSGPVIGGDQDDDGGDNAGDGGE